VRSSAVSCVWRFQTFALPLPSSHQQREQGQVMPSASGSAGHASYGLSRRLVGVWLPAVSGCRVACRPRHCWGSA